MRLVTDEPHTGKSATPFGRLHEQGCFVIPNPWDAGTAIALAGIGFPALATTSAGAAFARGLPDDLTALGVDDVLANVAAIVEATPLPVNADFQSGYAEDLDGLAAKRQAMRRDRCGRALHRRRAWPRR